MTDALSMDVARFATCADHADHVAKVFYGAAHALSGSVSSGDWGS